MTSVEEEFVLDALRSGWVAPVGPHVDQFEVEIARRVGAPAALAVSSGTAALHLALTLLGARPDTVVVCSSMTFAASANAIVYTGARPVFVDSDADDGNVDPQLLITAVDVLQSEGHHVVAAVVVDLFGRCADYAAISKALAERDVALIEDAAESLGASQRGLPAGQFGRAGILSFNGNKVMTTSGGGMLLSSDAELVERARYLATQARAPVPWYEHTEIGFNYRLSNILAALGRGQLSRLSEMIDRRRAIRAQYVERLTTAPGVRFLGHTATTLTEDNCWLTTIVLDPTIATLTAEELIQKLAAEDIEARHLWKPMHLQPVFASQRAFTTGVSERLFRTGVALPSGSSLTDDEVERVGVILEHALAAR